MIGRGMGFWGWGKAKIEKLHLFETQEQGAKVLRLSVKVDMRVRIPQGNFYIGFAI